MAERKRMKQRKPSRRMIEAWAADLRKLLASSATVEMRDRLQAEAGLAIPLLLGPEHAIRCHDLRADGLAIENLFRQWNVQTKQCNQEICEQATNVLPTFSPAHRRLAELAEKNGRFTCAVEEWMNVGVAGEVDEAAFAASLEKLTVVSGSDAWREWLKLWRICRECDIFGGAAGEEAIRLRNSVRRSLGRAEFTPVEGEEAQKLYSDAKYLYGCGKDLPRIIDSLEQSLIQGFCTFEVWRLYGDALRTAKRWPAAVLAYHEALACDVKDGEVVCALSRCYEELGFKKLAASAAWWAILVSKDDEVQKRSNSALRRVYPDVFL